VIGRNRVGTGRGGIAPAVIITLAGALGLGLALAARAPATRAASRDISIMDFAFEPGEITVLTGEPVTWTNKGAVPDTVTFDEGTVDSGSIGPGEAFGHVFEIPGTFTYHCTFHSSRMVATIIVKAAPVTPVPSGSVAPTPPAGTLPPNFSPFPTTELLPTPSPAPSPTPSVSPAPSAPRQAAKGDGGPGGIVGALLVVVVLGGVTTYLVRGFARRRS
jgi:plastocyanin